MYFKMGIFMNHVLLMAIFINHVLHMDIFINHVLLMDIFIIQCSSDGYIHKSCTADDIFIIMFFRWTFS